MNEVVKQILIEWLPTILECSTVLVTGVALIKKFKPISLIATITKSLKELKQQNAKLQEKIEVLEDRVHSAQLEAKGVKDVKKN